MTAWVQAVQQFDLIDCTGLLLLLASRLLHLSIGANNPRSRESLPRLFNQVESSGSLDSVISAVLALASLTSLSISSTQLHRHWYSLPELQHLEVDCTIKFPSPAQSGSITGVHTLSLRCSATFCISKFCNNSFDLFVQGFSDLKCLNVGIINWTESMERVLDRESFSDCYRMYSSNDGTWEMIRRPIVNTAMMPGFSPVSSETSIG
jgi:hypothetical protein